jgi:hypothetical protein
VVFKKSVSFCHRFKKADFEPKATLDQ